MELFHDDAPHDDLETAILSEALACHNGILALLERLTSSKAVGREDLHIIAQAMGKAYDTPHMRGNRFVQQIQTHTDEFLAKLAVEAN